MGFGKLRNQLCVIPELNLSFAVDDRAYFLNATLAATLTPALDLNLLPLNSCISRLIKKDIKYRLQK